MPIAFLGSRALEQVTSRLRFPQLFALTATLFVIDLAVPDLIPFVDEVLLGLLTAMLAAWREKVPATATATGERPTEKNVTPPPAR